MLKVASARPEVLRWPTTNLNRRCRRSWACCSATVVPGGRRRWRCPRAGSCGQAITGSAPGAGQRRGPRTGSSEQPATATLWRRLRAEHGRSGLWPLLLGGLNGQPERPWVVGEVDPESVDAVDADDPDGFLATMWTDWVEFDERHPESLGEGEVGRDLVEVAPFGRAWPGLAPAGELQEDPAGVADWYAGLLADGTARLGLVAADRSADALAVIGWYGAGNYVQETARLAAVVRSWEDRFGARVVGVGSTPCT